MASPRSLFLTFSTLGLPEAGWREIVAMAHAHDFAGVELRALAGSVNLASTLRQEFGSPETFARQVGESGIRVASLDSSLRLVGAQPEHREELARLAEWAQAAKIGHLRVFDGGESGSGGQPDVRAEMLREMDSWHRRKEKEGFSAEIVVETHWALTRPQDVLVLGKESEGRLRLLWDIGHTWLHSGVSLLETWGLLKPWIRHLHIKDIVRDISEAATAWDCLPGEGELPVPALLEELQREKFFGPVSFEWEKFWHPELPALDEAFQSGHRHGWW